MSSGSVNKSKTHCPRGHPYDDANTITRASGWRQCRTCKNNSSRAKYDPARQRAHNRRAQARLYGLTTRQYDAAIKKPCALCGTKTRKRLLDHSHETGELRGTLCRPCNTALGALGDNAAGLRRALRYVS